MQGTVLVLAAEVRRLAKLEPASACAQADAGRRQAACDGGVRGRGAIWEERVRAAQTCIGISRTTGRLRARRVQHGRATWVSLAARPTPYTTTTTATLARLVRFRLESDRSSQLLPVISRYSTRPHPTLTSAGRQLTPCRTRRRRCSRSSPSWTGFDDLLLTSRRRSVFFISMDTCRQVSGEQEAAGSLFLFALASRFSPVVLCFCQWIFLHENSRGGCFPEDLVYGVYGVYFF